MNRGQIKRIRKELDRLRKGGREWDALGMLARESVVEEFRADWDEIWRVLARQSLRTAAGVEEFLARIRNFDALPETADIGFLMIVGDYLEGRNVSEMLDSVKGLSPPAETLRRELRKQKDAPSITTAKQRNLLERFAVTPEDVLQKDYRQLGVQFSAAALTAGFRKACETLESVLGDARKLNSAPAIKKGIAGVKEADLRRIDLALNQAASGIPPVLFRVLAAPVLAQVSTAIGRIAQINPDQAARLALAAPFCMEMLAGTSWDGLRRKLQLESAHSLTASDRAELRKTAQTATFEEQLSLINKLSRLMSSQRDLDQDLQDTLIILYKGVFRELAKRREKLPDREQRKVAAVFGPVLEKHIDLLYGGSEDFPFFLDAAARAGCLDPSSALLHTFFAAMARDRFMIANARGMLKLLPPIQEKDVRDLFGQYQMYLSDDLKAMKGMLDICRECDHQLDSFVAQVLGMSLLSLMIMNTMVGGSKRLGLLDMFMEDLSDETSQECNKLIKGLDTFTGNPEFAFTVGLAKAFPTGRITGDGFGQLLEERLKAGLSVERVMADAAIMLEAVGGISNAQKMHLPFGDVFGAGSLQRDLLGGALQALCGSKERLTSFTTDSLTRLVSMIRKYGDGRGLERHMLLIGNAAAAKMEAGDEAAKVLHKTILDTITKNKKPAGRGGRR